MKPKDIKTQVDRVDGWLNQPEGRLLYRLAKRCTGRGAIVEIGSWKGKSTIWLGHGSRAGCGQKIHAVDPHAGVIERGQTAVNVSTFDEFQRNIRTAGVHEVVVPHVDFSDSVARSFSEPVELIFIDGLHDYEAVKADFEAWFPKVMEGGVMAFHDTTGQAGPRKLVTERVYKSPHFRNVRFARSITYAEKTARNTPSDRLGNRLMYCVFLTYAFVYRHLWRLKSNVRKTIPKMRLKPV
jgi:predicted O-methyltransferase YrrM